MLVFTHLVRYEKRFNRVEMLMLGALPVRLVYCTCENNKNFTLNRERSPQKSRLCCEYSTFVNCDKRRWGIYPRYRYFQNIVFQRNCT